MCTPHPNIVWVIKSRRTIWTVHVAHMGERCIQGFGGETLRDRPLGRHRCRWEDNIKMDLQEVRCGVWTGSSWQRTGMGGGHL